MAPLETLLHSVEDVMKDPNKKRYGFSPQRDISNYNRIEFYVWEEMD